MPKHYLAAILWDLRAQYEAELRTLTEAQRLLSEARDDWQSRRVEAVDEICERLRRLQEHNTAVQETLADALSLAEGPTPDLAVADASR
jgi:hypothetical protein